MEGKDKVLSWLLDQPWFIKRRFIFDANAYYLWSPAPSSSLLSAQAATMISQGAGELRYITARDFYLILLFIHFPPNTPSDLWLNPQQ